MLKACIGLKQVEFYDRRHCGLPCIPEELYRYERTLEELLLDFNSIQELPPKFFRLTALRKISMCENDLNRIPPGIANLTKLVELDLSKNAIEDVPPNMQFCRSLHFLDISSNPLLRTPEAISSVVSLTHLNINDVGIPRLPVEIGNLVNLAILEARENTLKSLPQSIAKLKRLQRLDLGNNEIESLTPELGELTELTELWLDTNLLSELPESITKLNKLVCLDVTKNRLEFLPGNFAALRSLCDLHLSENLLEALPQDIGKLQALTLLKLDLNHLVMLPESIGRLHNVTELLLFDNMLETVPPSLFEMQSLEMLNLDRNHLLEIPSMVGQCKTLHVMSLRENELCELPEEMGYLPNLKVLDIMANRIRCLPLSFSNLDLDALWIDGSQPQPLVLLESRPDLENPAVNKLYCPYLPQQGPYNSSMENFLEGSSLASDQQPTHQFTRTASFGKGAKLGVAFDPSLGPAPDEGSKLVRFPTPRRKDLKAKRKKYKPQAIPSTTIFRKGSVSSKDDLAVNSVPPSDQEPLTKTRDNGKNGLKENGEQGTLRNELPEYEEEPAAGRRLGLTKMAGMENLSQENLAEAGREQEEAGTTTADQNGQNGNVQASDMFTGAIYAEEGSDLPNGSVVRSIDVTIEIQKVAGRTLGFSIAGGRGSTPAYEDVDDSIYVTKIAPGGLAEQDGRLRLGDKLLAVNGFNMVNATHAEAVAALKSVTSSCQLVVSREVLVVLPEDVAAEEGEEQQAQQDQPTTPSHAPQQEEGEVGESGEDMAKKMVADILDRSLKRVSSDEDVLEDKEEEEAPPPSGQHDNYINYNIAQIVVKESRKVSVGEGSTGPSLTDTESPLHARPRPAWKESDDEYMPSPTRPSVSMSLDDDEEENYPEERVVLDRSIGRLGLSIVGGADHVSRVFGQGKPGVYVSKISKGGAAEATGKLRLGDRILEVNKFNVRFSTHQQAVQWLISQEGNIELVVQHVPQPPGLKEVLLKKEPGQKLGLSIRGGGKGSKGNPLDPNDEGIFISKVTKGGAAETSGGLAVGMRIVEVNGISLLGASHSQAVKALKSSPQLLITVCDGFDVKEVMKRKSLADTLEDDTISSVTVGSHVPLSAASSMVLDTAIHGLLSESIDGLATAPRKSNKSQSAIAPSVYSLMHSQLSHSSTAISNKTTPTTTKEEDFDKLLEDLAKFKVETSLGLKQLDEEQRSRRKSSPVSPLAYRQQQQQQQQEEQQESIPLSEIIAPLQNSGMGSIEDILDPSLGLELLSSESGVEVESEVGSPSKSEPSIDAELSGVELKDTSSMLADLDSEVFTMHEEVSKGESEMNKSEDAPPPGDEDITPKVQRKQSLKQKVALHKKASMQQLKPTPSPANPLLASPETRRRAEEIRINISPPPDAEASEEAVKSIIGEVFNDISFDEFERRSTSPGSGTFTPTDEDHVTKEVSSMDDVLSALKGLSGDSESSRQKEKKKEEEEVEDEKEPDFGPVPAAKERARTMPVVPPPVAAKPDVTLRVKTNHSDPNWRKSAPMPDHPTSPPSSSVSPEKLTFKEKLALHKKKADDSSPPLTSPHHLSGHTQTKSISASAIAPPPPTINRTSSAGKVPPPSSTEDNAPSTFDDRIAFLHNNQAKAGMNPVQVKKSASSERRMSAEERRMARIVKTEEPLESFSAPDVLKTSSPRHESADPGPSPQAASSNTNSNNSTDSVNPYVTQILRDMPPVVTPPDCMGLSADPRAERGRKWREEKEKELNEKCAEFQGMIDKLSNTGILESSSSFSDSKTKAPTTLV